MTSLLLNGLPRVQQISLSNGRCRNSCVESEGCHASVLSRRLPEKIGATSVLIFSAPLPSGERIKVRGVLSEF
jgi:hypothetical protein